MAIEPANDISYQADLLEGKIAPETQAPPVQAAPPVSQEAPAAEPVTPPTNEPNKPIDTPTPEQPTFNFDAELEKISGGAIKTQAEIAAIIERSNKVADLEGRLSNFEKENNDLKAKVSTDPFANEYTKRLNELYKSGASDTQIQAFTTLNKVANLEGLAASDARILALQIKNGLTEDEAKTYLASTYKLNPEEHDEATIKAEEIRLKVDANADREFLKTQKAEASIIPERASDIAQRELEQKKTEQVAKLQPVANTVLQTAKDLFKGISLNGKDGDQNIKADFEVSPESLSKVNKAVSDLIQNRWDAIPANEEGRKTLEDFARNILIQENYKTMIVNAASQRELQVRAEYNNPTPVNRGQDAPSPVKSAKDEFDQRLLNSY